MPHRIIVALTIPFLTLVNCSALHAQVTQQELEEQLAEARKVQTKLSGMGMNPEKDCELLSKNDTRNGDDRYVFVRGTGVITIKQYEEGLTKKGDAPERIAQLLERARKQAEALGQDCQIVLQIPIIEAQAGSALAQFVWGADYDGETIEAEGTVSKGYPNWTFRAAKLRADLPGWPRSRGIDIQCNGRLDAGGPMPAKGAPGVMTCSASWGQQPQTTWECKNGKGQARVLGPGGTQNFFFLVYNCIGTMGGKPKKFYEMGIRWNKLGSASDPPWSEYKSQD